MDDHSQDLINDFEKKCRQGIAEFEKIRFGVVSSVHREPENRHLSTQLRESGSLLWEW